jgi:hypothetical protein
LHHSAGPGQTHLPALRQLRQPETSGVNSSLLRMGLEARIRPSLFANNTYPRTGCLPTLQPSILYLPADEVMRLYRILTIREQPPVTCISTNSPDIETGIASDHQCRSVLSNRTISGWRLQVRYHPDHSAGRPSCPNQRLLVPNRH